VPYLIRADAAPVGKSSYGWEWCLRFRRGFPTPEPPRAKFHVVNFIHLDGTKARLLRDVFGWATLGNIMLSRHYLVSQVASLLKFAKETTNPQLAAVLIEKAADLKSQVDETSTTTEPSAQAPAVEPHA
jgi:hypothetical protein